MGGIQGETSVNLPSGIVGKANTPMLIAGEKYLEEDIECTLRVHNALSCGLEIRLTNFI